MTHVMIDLETTGTTPGCGVLAIGAAVFDEGGVKDTLLIPIGLAGCTAYTSDPATLAWWTQQSVAVRDPTMFPGNGYQVGEALLCLSSFLAKWGSVAVWGNGSTFDISILEHCYRAEGLTPPWMFWDVRDVRTFVDAVRLATGEDVRTKPPEGEAHNALNDAINQARYVARGMKLLGGLE